jgi:hypothetical protein
MWAKPFFFFETEKKKESFPPFFSKKKGKLKIRNFRFLQFLMFFYCFLNHFNYSAVLLNIVKMNKYRAGYSWSNLF